MTQTISFGYGSKPAQLLSNKLNRHGVIAGATGTGKTVTLKVLAEQLSEAGVPVLLSDIKGDLASLAEKGEVTEKIAERLKKFMWKILNQVLIQWLFGIFLVKTELTFVQQFQKWDQFYYLNC